VTGRPRQSTIRLVPFGERHLPGFAALLADPAVQRFTRVPAPAPPDFPETWLALYEQGRRDGTREALAIVEGDDEVFAGVALAFDIESDARTAELGYVIAPAARGRGVGTHALALLTDWAFSHLGLLRIELMISVENSASRRVAERCGYVREGVLRSVYVKEGLREDLELWSLLPGDPRTQA
jgi:RimJ/RimL family protein N-acetyltransferase